MIKLASQLDLGYLWGVSDVSEKLNQRPIWGDSSSRSSSSISRSNYSTLIWWTYLDWASIWRSSPILRRTASLYCKETIIISHWITRSITPRKTWVSKVFWISLYWLNLRDFSVLIWAIFALNRYQNKTRKLLGKSSPN